MRRLSAYGPSLIVLGTAALVLFAGPYAVRELSHAQTQARIQQASQRLADNPILEQLNDAFRDIAVLVEPSVVHISATRSVRDQFGQRRSLSSGSGWIWDDQGHIVTNYHVIEEANRVEVQLNDGTLRDADIIGFDRLTDIAVVKVAPDRIIPAPRVTPEEPVEQGDIVFAFGSPFDFRFSMSQGVVSGIGRSVGVIRPTAGPNSAGYENFIQVDAAINPGNSGGPLTNYRGEVVGMNTAIATRRDGNSADEGQFAGIGLAIPMSMIHPVVTQLIDTGVVTKGFLGVSGIPLSRQLVRELTDLGLATRGVIIDTVDPEGPALEAGVRPGDIVTAVDDTPIGSMDQLRATISSKFPGDTINLHVLRREADETVEQFVIDVRLEVLNSIRVNGVVPDDQDRGSIPEIGIAGMVDASDSVAQRFDMQSTPGVVITGIVDDSYLETLIEPGTTIIAVMGQPVSNVNQFITALRQYNLRDRRGIRVAAIDRNGDEVSFRLTVN